LWSWGNLLLDDRSLLRKVDSTKELSDIPGWFWDEDGCDEDSDDIWDEEV
jgi:hypothetical protein